MSEDIELKKTWLVFSVGDSKYALLSSDVKEIIRDVTVFPLPFVPSYINGILNRYGEPYAVIDPLPLLENKIQDSCLFIVLQGESHVCLKISEIIEFHTVSNAEIKSFSNSDSGKYYIGSFDFEDSEVLILNSESFIEVVEKDIEKS